MDNSQNEEKDGLGMTRITVSVPPDMYDALKRISDCTGQPMSKVLIGFLSDSVGIMRKTATSLESLQKLKHGIGKTFGKKYGLEQ